MTAVIAALLSAALLAGWQATPPADAAVRSCSTRVTVPNRLLNLATVTSVRDISCRAARRVVRRHGTRRSDAPYGDAGARFRLGRWRCVVTLHLEELWRARCVRGGRAFRVDYGF